MKRILAFGAGISIFLVAAASAQVQPPPAPWRGAGPPPCVGSDGGAYKCPPAPRTIAIRAGRLFDSTTGQMLTRRIVLVTGERIADVGPEASVRIPPGVQVLDLSQATVLPGLIDAHTHMFNTRGPKGTTEASMLMAVQNAQADLRAGFTSARDMSSHGNGYANVEIRNAINEGRLDGPRYQVSTLGIVWGATPPVPGVGVIDLRLHVADDRRVVVEPLGDHHVDLILRQAEAVLDRVASGDDRVALAFTAKDMAPGLLA